jgi:hypothetical protein
VVTAEFVAADPGVCRWGRLPLLGSDEMSDDLGPLPKVLPWDIALQEADTEALGFLIDLRKKHKLTRAQILNILGSQLLREISDACRSERNKKDRP